MSDDGTDHRAELATDMFIDCVDFSRIMKEFEEQYQRGRADERKDMAEALKAEYTRGWEAYRDEILVRMDALHAADVPKFLPPKTAPHNEKPEAAPPARPEPPPVLSPPEPEKLAPERPEARQRPIRTDIRGDTSAPPPEGIPTTFEMIGSILDVTPGLTAHQVGDAIRERWWPGMDFKRIGPEFSTWVRKGRLVRDDDGKLTLSESGRKIAFPTGFDPNKKSAEPHHVLPRDPPKPTPPMPPVQPTAGPRHVVTPGAKLGPPARSGVKFDYKGRSTTLASSREYVLAGKLLAGMGRGHIPESFLAQSILGMNTENGRETVKSMAAAMNARIAEVGLVVEHYPGFGFLMKEIAQ